MKKSAYSAGLLLALSLFSYSSFGAEISCKKISDLKPDDSIYGPIKKKMVDFGESENMCINRIYSADDRPLLSDVDVNGMKLFKGCKIRFDFLADEPGLIGKPPPPDRVVPQQIYCKAKPAEYQSFIVDGFSFGSAGGDYFCGAILVKNSDYHGIHFQKGALIQLDPQPGAPPRLSVDSNGTVIKMGNKSYKGRFYFSNDFKLVEKKEQTTPCD